MSRIARTSTSALLLLALTPFAAYAPASAVDGDPGAATVAPVESQGALEAEEETYVDLGKGTAPQRYIVQLSEPALPSSDVANKFSSPLLQASLDQSYVAGLAADQRDAVDEIADVIGARPQVGQRFTRAINGFTVTLTRRQAAKVAELDDVQAVTVDHVSMQDSDGTALIGAPSVWDGSAVPGGVGSLGEGQVIGIIDGGINPINKAFAVTVPVSDGGDGYVHANPLGAGNYLGMCDPASSQYTPAFTCNAKLIGAYNFTGDGRTYDLSGHGSHVASIAAGNRHFLATPSGPVATTPISGAAPHANLISYSVCQSLPTGDGCYDSVVVTAIEQAIVDDVDVINHSIGGSAASALWSGVKPMAFLNARAAGIQVAQSAGNNGSAASSIGSSGDVPWVTSVANTTADRTWSNTVTVTTDDESMAPIPGVALTTGTTGSFPIVLASTLGDALCRPEYMTAAPAQTGKIVLCDRGTNDRVAKSAAVKALGAAGMILANDIASGSVLVADPHALPSSHISYNSGAVLKSWISTRPTARASISAAAPVSNPGAADVVNASSSRGPGRAADVISPSLAAPGTNILAAYGSGNANTYGFLTGTSMAAPQVAGAMALIADLHPDWTPAQIQSALMTTSQTVAAGTAFAQGSGRIDLARAARAGLLFDVSADEFRATRPSLGGDIRKVNLPSMQDSTCLNSCEWIRTATANSLAAGTWSVSVQESSADFDFSVDKSSFTVAAGGTVDLTVTATALNSTQGVWGHATLLLTPVSGQAASPAHLPIAVKQAPQKLTSISVETRRAKGSSLSGNLRLPAPAADLMFSHTPSVAGVTKNTPVTQGMVVDTPVSVPAGTRALVVHVDETATPDVDMRVGPNTSSWTCTSAGYDSTEVCVVLNPAAGTWQVRIEGYQTTNGGTDTVPWTYAVIPNTPASPADEGAPTFSTAPAVSGVGTGRDLSLRTTWSIPTAHTWYFSLLSVTGPNSVSEAIPVRLRRLDDDLTSWVSPLMAEPGDVLEHTVRLRPDTRGRPLVHTISENIPAGTSYVAGSASGGGVFDGTKVTWTGTSAALATLVGTPTDQPVNLTYETLVTSAATLGQQLVTTTSNAVDNPGSEVLLSTKSVTVTAERADLFITTSPAAPKPGQAVTATVTATGPDTVVPTGEVSLSLDGAAATVSDLDASGKATFALGSFAAPGEHTLTAAYAGAGQFIASQDVSETLVITADPAITPDGSATPVPPKTNDAAPVKPVIKVKVAKKLLLKKKPKKATITLTAPGTKATGTVKVVIKGGGKKVTRTVKIAANGKAKVKLPRFAKAGKVTIKVTYAGSATVLAGKAKAKTLVRR